MNSINDLLKQWQQSLEEVRSQEVENLQEQDLLDVEGMRVRSAVMAGGPYMPKMTLYQGCSQYCK